MKKSVKWLCLLLVMVMLPIAIPARAQTVSGVVRVLLTRLNLTNRVEISLDGSYTLGSMAFQRGSDLVISSATGTLMVYYEGMAFDAGKTLTLTRHAVPQGEENGLRINGAYELHPGDLVLTINNGHIRPVLHAPVEEYLLGVVPYEMSDTFPLEALKAQAVAARTYVMKRVGAHADYDVVDNTNDQAYYGVKKENTSAVQAVQETKGVCGYYKGLMANCYYSASNGGQTELVHHVWGNDGGDYGYLQMFDDPYDVENKESVVKSALLPKRMADASGLGRLQDEVLGRLSETMESMGYDGDVNYIRVTGIENAEMAVPLYQDSPSKVMTLLKLSLNVEGRRLITEEVEEEISMFAPPPTPAPQPQTRETWTKMQPLAQPVVIALDVFPLVESALGLSINGGSNEIITVSETDDYFAIQSRRYGHGVGMSQRGAQCMARDYNWTYDQILRFYYPGMELKTLSYTHQLPKALEQSFLVTPGPAATPTPRPTPAPLKSTPAPGQYTVSVTNIGVNSYLNMRAEANTQSDVLRLLYYGQQLIVLSDLGDWLMVRTDDVTGYVMESFVNRDDAK
ncbi:MAG: SpoIID/LytB domain-containing protein [Clostridiales bacterium]|nr:SpoIID/LytB domain-containing protein [Clostridiales bacterium]